MKKYTIVKYFDLYSDGPVFETDSKEDAEKELDRLIDSAKNKPYTTYKLGTNKLLGFNKGQQDENKN